MKSINDFIPLVVGQCPGLMDSIARDAIVHAAIDFCKRTRLLYQSLDATVTSGESEVFLYPDDGLVYHVTSMLRDASPLDALSRHDFEHQGLFTRTGQPSAFFVDSGGRLIVGPVPDADETLTAFVTATPASTATQLPDVLWEDWRTAIAAGAKAYVRSIHAPYRDDQLEAYDRERFDAAIFRVNTERARGRTRRDLRTRGHFF